jgi:hypothetical protein
MLLVHLLKTWGRYMSRDSILNLSAEIVACNLQSVLRSCFCCVQTHAAELAWR